MYLLTLRKGCTLSINKGIVSNAAASPTPLTEDSQTVATIAIPVITYAHNMLKHLKALDPKIKTKSKEAILNIALNAQIPAIAGLTVNNAAEITIGTGIAAKICGTRTAIKR